MSVAEVVSLPDQPALGSNIQTPLGGDGWSAPSSVYEVAISLAGDAGGGTNRITVNFDPRYAGVVTYVQMRNSSASTLLEMECTLFPLGRSTPTASAFANAVPVNGLSSINLFTWCPPPLPHFAQLAATIPNVLGDTLTLFFYLYNFRVQAFEKVPLNIILASLPRAESQIPTTSA